LKEACVLRVGLNPTTFVSTVIGTSGKIYGIGSGIKCLKMMEPIPQIII
jgi:hypothetical protein